MSWPRGRADPGPRRRAAIARPAPPGTVDSVVRWRHRPCGAEPGGETLARDVTHGSAELENRIGRLDREPLALRQESLGAAADDALAGPDGALRLSKLPGEQGSGDPDPQHGLCLPWRTIVGGRLQWLLGAHRRARRVRAREPRSGRAAAQRHRQARLAHVWVRLQLLLGAHRERAAFALASPIRSSSGPAAPPGAAGRCAWSRPAAAHSRATWASRTRAARSRGCRPWSRRPTKHRSSRLGALRAGRPVLRRLEVRRPSGSGAGSSPSPESWWMSVAAKGLVNHPPSS